MAVGEYPTYEQKGLREPLLCQKCETKVSVWEKYGRSVLFSEAGVRYEQDGELTWLHNVDYVKFKLFLMSILWRAGAARGSFWERVQLGHHEEKLRLMLLAEQPGAPEQYGCLPWRIHHKDIPLNAIIQPTASRIGTCAGYRFTFAGVFWAFAVSSHRDPKLTRLLLQSDGRMLLGPKKDISEARFFREMIQRLVTEQPGAQIGAP